jgi:tyrosyl-tRNA synthetase
MSKSAGNYIGVTDPAEDMFGKVMSIPDSALETYYRLLLLEEAPDEPPVQAKRALGRRIVDRFHGEGEGKEAEARFDTVHVKREAPDDMPQVQLSEHASDNGEIHLPALIAGAFGISTSEARRLISQGGVKLDGASVPSDELDMARTELEGKVLQVGKRRFARLG